MRFTDLVFWFLGVCGFLALIFNVFLILLILFCTRSALGLYKWILIVFGLFESCYALIVFLGTPIHLVTEKVWIVISHDSLLKHTPFYLMGPSVYCLFWYMWIFFVAFLFVYRYVVVCHNNFKNFIQHSNWMKLFLFFFYSAQVAYSITCGVFWCTRMTLSDDMKQYINHTFGFDDFDKMGFMLFGTRNLDGSFSPSGAWALANHYLVICLSGVVIIYCTVDIYRTLENHCRNLVLQIDVQFQRQLFYTLLVQTSIPFLMYHIPTVVFLTFPLWPDNSQFGSAVPLFSCFTTFTKILDPIVTIIGIKDYRRAVMSFCTCWNFSWIKNLTCNVFRPRSS